MRLLRHLRRHAGERRLRRAELALSVGGLSLGLGTRVLERLAGLPELTHLGIARLQLGGYLAELLLNLARLGLRVSDTPLRGLLPSLARRQVSVELTDLLAKSADVGDGVEVLLARGSRVRLSHQLGRRRRRGLGRFWRRRGPRLHRGLPVGRRDELDGGAE